MKKIKRYFYKLIGKEISSFSRYYDRVIQWQVLKHDSGELFEEINCRSKMMISENQNVPDLSNEKTERSILLLNGTFNYCLDIQSLLSNLKPKLSRTSRIVVVAYNPYFKWFYWLANLLRLRDADLPVTFITRTDLENIAKISGYEVVSVRPTCYMPFLLFGIGTVINWVFPLLPFFRFLCFASILVLRPVINEREKPSLSILVPARNEKENIKEMLERIPKLDTKVEIIFIEGHSKDGTWEEIQRVSKEYSSIYTIKTLQQPGVGKNDAVCYGFEHATGKLITILDADLTMPPEQIERFYLAYCQGLADFVNGSRLVYPMEDGAMRFLNRLGNVFFAKMLSFILQTKIGDSLCGTKLLALHDYHRIVEWRKDFGNFDPFGDFDLLFAASNIGFGIIDIPIRYRSRTYGDTNISRFSHGWSLLKMTLIGLFRVRSGKV